MQLKKLDTAEDRKKKKQMKQIIVGIILVAVMILGTLGYALREDKEEFSIYNGIKFIKTEQGWLQKEKNLLTTYTPKDVQNITCNCKTKVQELSGAKAYFVSTKDLRANINEISKNIGFINMQLACLNISDSEMNNKIESACEEDFPIKNCEDGGKIFVFIKDDDKREIYEQDNCIFIKAPSDEIGMAIDRFLFSAYNIM